MIYYVLTGGEWVRNYDTCGSDIPFEASYFIKFKTQPTIEKLKLIFIDLYMGDKKVLWNHKANKKENIELRTILKSSTIIEEIKI